MVPGAGPSMSGVPTMRPVPVDLARLADDLRAETAQLEMLLTTLDAREWAAPTPAPGWSVHDQVTHLAFFDGATTTALLDPDRFVVERDRGPGRHR